MGKRLKALMSLPCYCQQGVPPLSCEDGLVPDGLVTVTKLLASQLRYTEVYHSPTASFKPEAELKRAFIKYRIDISYTQTHFK